ncbi:hypothetical protein [Vibrio parahaemolyticus]|uniref:hypothetical protein n=3 Tax=Vibrio parahaemolyticus TaxID=670 RepID=UPI00186AA829|nr:hypothetical protein [Vibrio parahaemolyticus]MBE3932613.1 hypothetical protein [Vibrio parahaemolyticus]MBE4042986.1 hypothetical protein [Vibrio parahaemolyticus]MCG6443152.1 hypothetical protein [Vibrio parahaemolyticus]MCG6457127.1 hypothetical protein [Vibrio parahaemolyticus]HCH1967005.1 hypothetical protein [Vibrio parahaemolyticus]
MKGSKSYASAYSFKHVDVANTPDFDSLAAYVSYIEQAIDSFAVSSNHTLLFSTDYSDFKVNGSDLETRLLEITGDPSAAIHFLSEFEKAIGINKAYLDTTQIVNAIQANPQEALPFEYAYKIGFIWPGVSDEKQISSYTDLCNQNSFNFKNGVTTRKGFTDKAKIVYEHIQFHPQFEDKLQTIKRGTFMDYLSEFSHCLNTLNQASFEISKEENQNLADLQVISDKSAEPELKGRMLACTRQGANKLYFDFENLNRGEVKVDSYGKEKVVYPLENINSEYHLKLNFNDQGIKIQSDDDYNRAYFAMKYCDVTDKKYIKLAYIGEHWPPKKGEKKRK